MDHPKPVPENNAREIQEAESRHAEFPALPSREMILPVDVAAAERVESLGGAQVARNDRASGDAPLQQMNHPEGRNDSMEKQYRELDASVLDAVERTYGHDITEERLREAREHSTHFQPHREYQEGLRSAYPNIGSDEAKSIVGDLRNGNERHVDANDVELPRTVAHEQLHQLSDGDYRDILGPEVDEGTTEHLSREAIPGLHLRDLPEGYPNEEKLVGMLEARVGPELARAYFRGDFEPMRSQFDAQLGSGALEQFARLTREGKLDQAIALLKGPE